MAKNPVQTQATLLVTTLEDELNNDGDFRDWKAIAAWTTKIIDAFDSKDPLP